MHGISYNELYKDINVSRTASPFQLISGTCQHSRFSISELLFRKRSKSREYDPASREKRFLFFFYHKELQRYPKTLYSFLLGSELLFMIDKSTAYIHFQGNEGWTTFKSSLELSSKLFIKTFTCLIVCFP